MTNLDIIREMVDGSTIKVADEVKQQLFVLEPRSVI